LDRHQIANIALGEVRWISIGSDATRRQQNGWSVLVVRVLEDNATERASVLDGAPPNCSWKLGDDISRNWWRGVLRGGRPEWRASA
jgi:hypothetical protein